MNTQINRKYNQTVCVPQVWEAAVAPSHLTLCKFREDRIALLPQNYWKHTHGEVAL